MLFQCSPSITVFTVCGTPKAHFLKGSCGSLTSTQYTGGKVQSNLPLGTHNDTPESQRQPYTCAWKRAEPWMFPNIISTLWHAAGGDYRPECIWLAQNAPGVVVHNEYPFQSGLTGQQNTAFFRKLFSGLELFFIEHWLFQRYIWKIYLNNCITNYILNEYMNNKNHK